MEPTSTRSMVFLKITMTVLILLCIVLVTDIMFTSRGLVKDIFSIYLIASSLLSFHKSAMKDPGCLNSSADQCFDIQLLCLKGGVQVVPDPLSNTRRIVFPDNRIYVQKYCLTCNIFRPMGASHCSECGGCILERDHHCIWLDNCVGRNNIKHFFCFVVSLALLTYHSIYSLGALYACCKECIPYYCYLPVAVALWMLSVSVSLLALYNMLLALLDVSSREFMNSGWSSLPKPNLCRVVRRLCTIRPYIIARQESV